MDATIDAAGGPAHLDARVRAVLLLPPEDRIAFARRQHFLSYPLAAQAIGHMEDLLAHPPSERMPNILLVGEGGNGKSTILRRFQELHPVTARTDGTALAGVIRMQMPAEPSETRFWTELLLALHVAHRDNDPPQRKRNQAVSVLGRVGCRVLMIDEFHNILFGHARQQRQLLGVLKNLSNEIGAGIVGAGTRDAVLALRADGQFSTRFRALQMPKWRLDHDFLRLLAGFERVLPLEEPSGLAGRELAGRLHVLSRGLIGNLAIVLRDAAADAIRRGVRRIDLAALRDVGTGKAGGLVELADV